MSGQDHQQTHQENGGGCACGHDHTMEHSHDAPCSCSHDNEHTRDSDGIGAVHTEYHLHDEACVISGRLTVAACYDAVRADLSRELERIAQAVQEMGGIVGHIKASCAVTDVEMFSVTDRAVAVKKAPEQEIKIKLAAIVFLVEPAAAAHLVTRALEAVRDRA